MKNSSTRIVFLSILLTLALSLIQCKKKENKPLAKYELELNQPDPALKPFDSSLVAPFFEKFPELKANQQYQLLIQSIKECENELESARTNYNSSVRSYNTSRSSIPTIFYAPILGFKVAPYLEFEGNDLSMDIQTLNTFSSDVDGERLNELLGKAGGKLREASEQTFEAGKVAARKVVEGGKIIAEKAQDKIEEIRTESQNENTLDKNTLCSKCGVKISVGDVYCPKCGNIIDI